MTMSSETVPLGDTSLDQRLDDLLRFMGIKHVDENKTPIFILVVGMTGSGKSTLIQHCTGIDTQIGHGLQSCTNDLAVYSFFRGNYHVHMIDTPGFDDTNRSDIDTLKTISTHLSASFVNGVRISGIIYLHRISDNRLGKTGFQNLRMFKKLSGAATWPNTVLGTCGWQNDQHEHGERRELELMGNYNYFGEMISRGAKIIRVAEHGTGIDEQKRSALCVISYLILQKISRPAVELAIQRELVIDGKCLDATSAGREALDDLGRSECQLARQLQGTRQDMQEALDRRDEKHVQELRNLEEDCKRRVESSKRQQESLRTSLMEMHSAEVQRIQTKLNDMEIEQRDLLARKRQELEDMEDSLRRMREQSALDTARWEKQRLDIAALQKRQRANDEFHRECEQSCRKIKREAARQEARLRSISRAKGTVRHELAGGLADGAATAITTAIGTAAFAGLMCVVS